MQSDSRHNAPTVLASMREERTGDQQQDEQGQGRVWHLYPFEGGGFVVTEKPIEEEQGQSHTPVVESEATQPQPRNDLAQQPRVLFCLRVFALVLFFLFLDSATPLAADLFTPTATITLMPAVHTLRLSSEITLGRLSDPLTISQSQTSRTTGQGHQDARAATGTLTLYNGLATSQTLAAGTQITATDGIAITTDITLNVPADNPPNNGVATVPAHALLTGPQGNIAAGDMNAALAVGLFVKNLAPFTGGRNARDFRIVTPQDLESAGAGLAARVSSSMDAAFHGQIAAGEQIIRQPCQASTTDDHAAGDQASSVTVTVRMSCQAIVYQRSELATRATRQLAAQVQHRYGTGYRLNGTVQVRVTQARADAQTVRLSFTSSATFVYVVTAQMQQQLKTLLAGKPRLSALRYLTQLHGIRQATISGIQEHAVLPEREHIHVVLMVLLS